jgi:hypothetical protein
VDIRSFEFLYKHYKGKYWYWEIIESIRKLLLTAVISVIKTGEEDVDITSNVYHVMYLMYSGSSVQVAVGFVISWFAHYIYKEVKPYEEPSDNILDEISQIQIYLSFAMSFIFRTGKND